MTAPAASTAAEPMRFDGTTGRCPRCGRVTATGLLRLSSGHIGRVCADCGTARKGHPYARQLDFMFADLIPPPTPHGADGEKVRT